MSFEYARVAELSADQLKQARDLCLPIFCQTMYRRSRIDPKVFVYADVEELTREFMDEKVIAMEANGWRRDGAHFVRQRKKGPAQ